VCLCVCVCLVCVCVRERERERVLLPCSIVSRRVLLGRVCAYIRVYSSHVRVSMRIYIRVYMRIYIYAYTCVYSDLTCSALACVRVHRLQVQVSLLFNLGRMCGYCIRVDTRMYTYIVTKYICMNMYIYI
jgi:hypothetical protein